MRLLSVLLVALLVAAAQASAEDSNEAPRRTTGEAHGPPVDETRATRDAGQTEAAPVERSGSSAARERARPSSPTERGILPFIILKSIERPYMMSPPR